LPTESRFATHDDPQRWPRLAQPGHDQLDHGGRMPGTVDPAPFSLSRPARRR
jgi:hypothetical protein